MVSDGPSSIVLLRDTRGASKFAFFVFFIIAVQTAIQKLLLRIQFPTLRHGRLHSVSSVACELEEIPCSDIVIEMGTESFGE
jgi:hypothetical protein